MRRTTRSYVRWGAAMRVLKREMTGLSGRLSDLREVGLASFLLLAVALVAGLAAIGGGAIDLRGGARVEVTIAVAGLISVIGIATGALRVPRTRVWIPVGLLGAFAAWSALSMIWSVAPDGSWLAANRAIAYCAAAAIVLVAASSVGIPRRLPQSAWSALRWRSRSSLSAARSRPASRSARWSSTPGDASPG